MLFLPILYDSVGLKGQLTELCVCTCGCSEHAEGKKKPSYCLPLSTRLYSPGDAGRTLWDLCHGESPLLARSPSEETVWQSSPKPLSHSRQHNTQKETGMIAFVEHSSNNKIIVLENRLSGCRRLGVGAGVGVAMKEWPREARTGGVFLYLDCKLHME